MIQKNKELRVRIDRLQKLADFLETVPIESFNLETFAGSEKAPFKLRMNLCGTTACALGWATEIPEFKNEGLTLCFSAILGEADLIYLGTGGRGYTAAGIFFNLPESDTRYLFDPNKYRFSELNKPLVVVHRLRLLISRYKALYQD